MATYSVGLPFLEVCKNPPFSRYVALSTLSSLEAGEAAEPPRLGLAFGQFWNGVLPALLFACAMVLAELLSRCLTWCLPL